MLLPYFKSDYVNAGIDEAFGLEKYQLKSVCKGKDADNAFIDHLNIINELKLVVFENSKHVIEFIYDLRLGKCDSP